MSGFESPTDDELQAVLNEIYPHPRQRRNSPHHPHVARVDVEAPGAVPTRGPMAQRLYEGSCKIATSVLGLNRAIQEGIQNARRQQSRARLGHPRAQVSPEEVDNFRHASQATLTAVRNALNPNRVQPLSPGHGLGTPQEARRHLSTLQTMFFTNSFICVAITIGAPTVTLGASLALWIAIYKLSRKPKFAPAPQSPSIPLPVPPGFGASPFITAPPAPMLVQTFNVTTNDTIYVEPAPPSAPFPADPSCTPEGSSPFYRRDSSLNGGTAHLRQRDYAFDDYCEFNEDDDQGQIIESIMGNIGLPRLYASPNAKAFEMAIYHPAHSAEKVDIFQSGNIRAMMWMTLKGEDQDAPKCTDPNWQMPPPRSGLVDKEDIGQPGTPFGLHDQVCYGPWSPANTFSYDAYELNYGDLAKNLNKDCQNKSKWGKLPSGTDLYAEAGPSGRSILSRKPYWFGSFQNTCDQDIDCSDLFGHRGDGDGGTYMNMVNSCKAQINGESGRNDYYGGVAAHIAFSQDFPYIPNENQWADHGGYECGFLVIHPLDPDPSCTNGACPTPSPAEDSKGGFQTEVADGELR
ncbi:MAG: hypothetical protein Q9227_000149 [Pyrenula ochraceoflavens]